MQLKFVSIFIIKYTIALPCKCYLICLPPNETFCFQLTSFIFSGDETILIPVEDKNIKVRVLSPAILKIAFIE